MTPTDKVRAALEEAEYALDRSILFKPPQSSQREVELSALAAVKQALRELDGMSLIETEKVEGRDGMVLVPVEPTGTQMIAGGKKHQPNKHGEHETLHSLLARETYHAMIAPYVKGGVRMSAREHDRRVTELLEANNKLVEQLREAKRLLVNSEKLMGEAQDYIVRELLNKPDLLAEEVELVTQAVTCAAEAFRWYEKMHRDKPDHEKADRNRDFAIVMENALAVLGGKRRIEILTGETQ